MIVIIRESLSIINEMDTTEASVHINDKYAANLLHSMKSLQSKRLLCDAYLRSERGITIPVHSVILAASSSSFKDYLNETMAQQSRHCSPVVISIDTSVKCMELIIEFMYSGNLDKCTSMETLHKVHKVAQKHNLLALVELCVSKYNQLQNQAFSIAYDTNEYTDFKGSENMPTMTEKRVMPIGQIEMQAQENCNEALNLNSQKDATISKSKQLAPDQVPDLDVPVSGTMKPCSINLKRQVQSSRTVKGMLDAKRKMHTVVKQCPLSSNVSVKSLLEMKKRHQHQLKGQGVGSGSPSPTKNSSSSSPTKSNKTKTVLMKNVPIAPRPPDDSAPKAQASAVKLICDCGKIADFTGQCQNCNGRLRELIQSTKTVREILIEKRGRVPESSPRKTLKRKGAHPKTSNKRVDFLLSRQKADRANLRQTISSEDVAKSLPTTMQETAEYLSCHPDEKRPSAGSGNASAMQMTADENNCGVIEIKNEPEDCYDIGNNTLDVIKVEAREDDGNAPQIFHELKQEPDDSF